MTFRNPLITVAGHICLDIIPTFSPDAMAGRTDLADLLAPGTLTNTGPALTATGGAVTNTGLALYQLGVNTRLMGKVGADQFGQATLDVLRSYDPALADGMIVDADAASSYTIVINPPGVDRVFLHYPGPNDTFAAADVSDEALRATQIFHFGYPPIMARMFAHNGQELVALLQRARQCGAVTSLDMAYPDPASPAGQADWPAILAGALPHADIFLPSLEETLFMLDREHHDALRDRGDIIMQADGALLRELSDRILAMGVAVAGLKLGEQGFYVRTTDDAARLGALAPLLGDQLDGWLNRELLAPCFRIDVAGTTGAGDSTIAGFLAGLSRGLPLEETVDLAAGVGACRVESLHGSRGIPALETVRTRINAGWPRRSTQLSLHSRNGPRPLV
ncbi:MAG: carbohydrate kinase family protein [Caldilineaceae bacterium]|nr:carbohydrate kinase family protein [Caldilineaceae bacterium]